MIFFLENGFGGHFGIKFTMGEIQDFKNVGEMIDSIEKHLAK